MSLVCERTRTETDGSGGEREGRLSTRLKRNLPFSFVQVIGKGSRSAFRGAGALPSLKMNGEEGTCRLWPTWSPNVTHVSSLHRPARHPRSSAGLRHLPTLGIWPLPGAPGGKWSRTIFPSTGSSEPVLSDFFLIESEAPVRGSQENQGSCLNGEFPQTPLNPGAFS